MDLSRVSALQEPTSQPLGNVIPNTNNIIPITVSQPPIVPQDAPVDPVTIQNLRRNPVLIEQAKARQQAFQTATSCDPSQGSAQGGNPNNNILLDAQHHGSNYKSSHFNQIHGRVLNNDFPSQFLYNNTQTASTNIKSGRNELAILRIQTFMFAGPSNMYL